MIFPFSWLPVIDAINHENDSIFCIRQSTGQPSFQIDAGKTHPRLKFAFSQTGMGTDKTFRLIRKAWAQYLRICFQGFN